MPRTATPARKRVPDVTPTPDVVGHLRDAHDVERVGGTLEGAVLGCGAHRLPDGANY